MPKFSEFKLGQTVRDAGNGLMGHLVGSLAKLDGTHQLLIQPINHEGNKVEESWFVDWNTVDIVDVGIADRAITPIKHAIKLGQKVRDRVVGVEGTVTSITTHLNGCVHATVTPKARFFGLVRPDTITTAIGLLDSLEKRVAPITPKVVAPVKKRGGPPQRAGRTSY